MTEESKEEKIRLTEEERQERLQIERKKRKKKVMFLRFILTCAVVLFVIGVIQGISYKNKKKKELEKEQIKIEQEKRTKLLSKADEMVLSYDYDGAIKFLKSQKEFQKDEKIVEKISDIEKTKETLVPVNMDEITHIVYHSLIIEPQEAFRNDDLLSPELKLWRTTVDEFQKITQEMYNRGYVLIDLHDMVNETVDKEGKVHFITNQIMLPEGKKPFVLSVEDLSYHHIYEGRGIASKIVLDEQNKPICEYIKPDGEKVQGAYDCVPLLDKFIEAHPDASYKGAKGMITLTGYNGILGYRTDLSYKTRENLGLDQIKWLEQHPDFDWDKECEEAKKVAKALKKDGWTFASRTWGNIGVGKDSSLEKIKKDTEKWKQSVEPLVGETDTITFVGGEDIGDWHDYGTDNEKFNYLKEEGFHYFCNVDPAQYFLQMRDNYVRQGRRNLDGYRLWNDVHGKENYTKDLFEASQVLDPERKDMPQL